MNLFKLEQYVAYPVVALLLFISYSRKNASLINMRFCDSCYEQMESFKKLYRIIQFSIVIVIALIMGYLLKDTQWVIGFVFLMGLMLIAPVIVYKIFRKSPLIDSVRKDSAVLSFPDSRYKEVFEEFQKNSKTNPNLLNKIDPVICQSCGNSNIPGSQFCEKCGVSTFADKS
jgi:hypothetical protein